MGALGKMKTLLILGAGRDQVAAITRAKKKNIRTIAIDQNVKAEGAQMADEFYPISTRDVGAILDFLKTYKNPIDGVMTIATDIPHCVSAAAEFLGVQCIPKSVADVCVDKYQMKEVLKRKQVNVPEFTSVESMEDVKRFIDEVGYPIVLKPVDNSGSRGVLRITQDTDLDWAFNFSKQYSFSGRMIAEKFIAGSQISTEGIMLKDTFYVTGFADRNYENIEQTTPFIVEDGGEVPSQLSAEDQKKINEEYEKATRGLGIDWGPSKGDMVLGLDGNAYVIELAARLSGGNFCSDTVPFTSGVDIVDILIDMAIGNEVDVKSFTPTKNLVVCQRYFFPKAGTLVEIKGVDEVKQMEHIVRLEVWPEIGETLQEPINHVLRAGNVVFYGNTHQEAIKNAIEARDRIEFVVQ